MNAACGYAGTILSVDLSSHTVEKIPLDTDLARDYIGGHGINAKLLYDLVKPGIDPLSPENVLIFGTGPLVGTMAPVAARATAMAKSPLSGLIGISNAGHFGAMLKFAGYDHLVIKGRAERPVYLNIDDEDVQIVDAAHLWGKDVAETTDALWQEIGDEYWVTCIGQAGENLVRFAAILCNKHSAFGRTGLGAVMGSKNLKAIAIRGRKSVTVADGRKFMKLVDQNLQAMLSQHTAEIKMFQEQGTYAHVLQSGHMNFIPRPSRDTEAFDYQKCMDAFQRTNVSCIACPVGCKQWLKHENGMEFGASCTAGTVGMPYGVELLLPTWTDIGKAADLGQRYGVDSIDMAGMISWALELYENGVITKEDTDGLELLRGDAGTTLELMRRIAYREGFGDTLAEGIVRACQRVGRGSEAYAQHIKGLGKPPRLGLDLRAVLKHTYQFGGVVNPRGWHPDCYRVVGIPFSGEKEGTIEAIKDLAPMFGIPPQAMAAVLAGKPYNIPLFTKFAEEYYVVVHSLGLCDRPFALMSIEILADFYLAATGLAITAADLLLAGERVWNIQKAFNIREGASRQDDRVPERVTREAVEVRAGKFPPVLVADVNVLIEGYYEARSWEKETGKPTAAKLKALGLEAIARDLALPS